jgi:hypothetical protein
MGGFNHREKTLFTLGFSILASLKSRNPARLQRFMFFGGQEWKQLHETFDLFADFDWPIYRWLP